MLRCGAHGLGPTWALRCKTAPGSVLLPHPLVIGQHALAVTIPVTVMQLRALQVVKRLDAMVTALEETGSLE